MQIPISLELFFWHCKPPDGGMTTYLPLHVDAQEITFGLDIGRRMIADGMTDVSWYLEHVVLPVKRAGFVVYRIEFNEWI